MRNDEIPDLESLKADIAGRLRNVCAHFSDGEFAALVEQIAQVERKYAQRALKDKPPADP